MQPSQNASDKKYSPISKERKSDFSTSLYQLSRVLEKDQQTYSKLYKSKETQQKKVQKSTIASRPTDKLTEKLSIYQQYVQSKTKKAAEEYKSALNVSNQASSRASSRILAPEEQNESLINKVCDINALATKRYVGVNDSSLSKSKPKVSPGHQKNLSTSSIKAPQKASMNSGSRNINLEQGSTHNISFNDVAQDYSKTPDARGLGGERASNAGDNFNEALANKLKLALQGLQGDLQNARHRRGLSSGQKPIFIDQEAPEKIEKIKPIELVPESIPIPVDPQQEQDEFFEQFFHSDQMTFDFERLIVSQRNKSQNVSQTASTTPINQKKPMTAHARTRSIEDPSMLATKASSRWNTKRSSVGEEVQPHMKEAYNLIDKLSEFDRTEGDKDERRRYLRG